MNFNEQRMQTLFAAALILLFGLSLPLVSCERRSETLGEKVEERVDDGLDRRPAEGIRDVGEDIKNEVD